MLQKRIYIDVTIAKIRLSGQNRGGGLQSKYAVINCSIILVRVIV